MPMPRIMTCLGAGCVEGFAGSGAPASKGGLTCRPEAVSLCDERCNVQNNQCSGAMTGGSRASALDGLRAYAQACVAEVSGPGRGTGARSVRTFLVGYMDLI